MDFFLSIINSIKLGDAIPENGILKQYDKNQNSIWDENEIKCLQDEVLNFAGLDNDSKTLTKGEMNNYIQNLLSRTKNIKEKIDIKNSYKKMQILSKMEYPTYENFVKILSFQSNDLQKVLKKYEKFNIKISSGESIQISVGDINTRYNYIFDKKGLIEYKEQEDDEWADIPFSNEYINAYNKNSRNGIEQWIKYRRYDPSNFNKYDIEEMVIKQGNVTTTISKNEKGLYNIEEKDCNGKCVYIQKITLNEETEILTLTRNIISPDNVKSEFKSESNSNITRLSYNIIDSDGNVLLDKSSTLLRTNDNPEMYLYQVSEFNTLRNFEITIVDNSIKIKNTNNNLEHSIELTDYVQGNDNINFFMEILKKVPANQLFLLTGEHLKALIHDTYSYDGGCCVDGEDNKKYNIEIGIYDNEQDYLNVFMHEYGHYIDNITVNVIGRDAELKEIYKIEYENFLKNTTLSDKEILEHIVNDEYCKENVGMGECVAETNSLINVGVTTAPNQLRIYYFQKYFPRTIAKIEKLIFDNTKVN